MHELEVANEAAHSNVLRLREMYGCFTEEAVDADADANSNVDVDELTVGAPLPISQRS